jgi:hypothetical protein
MQTDHKHLLPFITAVQIIVIQGVTSFVKPLSLIGRLCRSMPAKSPVVLLLGYIDRMVLNLGSVLSCILFRLINKY